MKRIAIVGSGIAGTSSAYYLNKLGYEVSLFESDDHFGGHTHTHDIEWKGHSLKVDTGFLVHNNRTYPNLIHFFDELGIETHESDMSFSVIEPNDNISWAGTNLLTLFGQYKNILSPRFYRFVSEILRFNKNSQHYLEIATVSPELSLGDLLVRFNYSEDFKKWYLLPMGGCIWSTPVDKMLSFPAYSFIRFCINHGLLQVTDRPQWKTLVGGCATYVEKALNSIENKYLNEPVISVMKVGSKVRLKTIHREEQFDAIIFCCHPPQSLKIVKDINLRVRENLSHFHYTKNTAVLHWDKQILPEKRFWSAWNYRSSESSESDTAKKQGVSVTYLINKLQPLPIKDPILVTLNPVSKINPDKIWKKLEYEHPVFDENTISAQEKMESLQGIDQLYFCGAWMRYGFHEDGILSAKKVLNQFFKHTGAKHRDLEIYE
ncbi:MAG: NAD/FAD-binding protein [Halobacteriovoraceae bacterium]|nr:NAD/FAD-binding protein [Halobacteriovoraceae bacterium]MBC97069.1 NAD/FAD-binding protein [Halobacteriovoraceae bacterium]|tara:strand:+ start:88154 stop:89452 length:1299 start_codon:yes stop_codon:yes gene_type:complete